MKQSVSIQITAEIILDSGDEPFENAIKTTAENFKKLMTQNYCITPVVCIAYTNDKGMLLLPEF